MNIPNDLKPKNLQQRGGRPAAHSLIITQPEFDWLYKAYTKRAALIPSAKKATTKLKKSIVSTLTKLEDMLPFKEELLLNRDELQVLIHISQMQLKGLVDIILPEYERRHVKSVRAEEARELARTLTRLVAKGELIYDAGSHRRGNRKV